MNVPRAIKRLFVHAPPDPVEFWRRRADDPGWHSVMWRNAAYNECAHRDQWEGIVRHLPARRGAVLDLGCGTGRLTGPLMQLFDDYVGVDLDTMIAAARVRNPAAADRYVVSRVQDYRFERDRFDLVLSMACLSAAVAPADLPGIAAKIAAATRAGGHVILLDPFHTLAPVARIGRMRAADVIGIFERQGMRLLEWTGMHFIPVRMLLAGDGRGLSPASTRAAYALGEVLNRVRPRLFSDYHLIALQKPAGS